MQYISKMIVKTVENHTVLFRDISFVSDIKIIRIIFYILFHNIIFVHKTVHGCIFFASYLSKYFGELSTDGLSDLFQSIQLLQIQLTRWKHVIFNWLWKRNRLIPVYNITMNDPRRQHGFEHISCTVIESILIFKEMFTFDLVVSIMLALVWNQQSWV